MNPGTKNGIPGGIPLRYLRKAAKIQAMPQPKQAIVTTQLVSGDLKFPTARVNKSNPAAIITNRLKILIIPKKCRQQPRQQ